MESLKIVWNKRAVRRNREIATWYKNQMGYSVAVAYIEGIADTINTLSHTPHIGKFEFSIGKNKYYSFLSHPKYRILYRFTKTRLYVVAIRATVMNNNES
ncbi:MAG: type II toxin-antitoxin system RelE/ParE family toxin [Bacteroides sp.]|jgi:plasmid stabilization system protein ParE|nr:type II toxin-antitoxin system RelE/ParE family toxin [Bacteroides sp.]